MNQPAYDIDQVRGCTRYTLRIPGTQGFPQAIVTARVIPERFTNTFRVVVAAGSKDHSVIVTDLCQNNLSDHAAACDWARECIRAAEQFWQDCQDAD